MKTMIAICALAAASIAPAPAAFAETPDSVTRSVTVRVDLDRPEDAEARIRSAAARVCADGDRALTTRRMELACVERAVADAMRRSFAEKADKTERDAG